MTDARDDADAIAREIVARCGKELRVATPLGLGKPITLLNALTRLAVEDSSIRLSIFTALTLEAPAPSDDMARRLLDPARDRLFGAYPRIDYAHLLCKGELPANIAVNEFFFLAGRWKGVGPAQRNYIPVNFSHALDVLADRRPNLVLHLLAGEGDRLSLSCNTDITVDLLRLRREGAQSFLLAGEVNGQLPFMPGNAEIDAGEVEWLFDPPGGGFELFSAVKRPVSNSDHAIGLHVSRLIRDGGTLQIGIGAIGDAVAHALLLRQRGKIAEIHAACPFPAGGFDEAGGFETGLYGMTEMLVDAMLPLFKAGVIDREVDGTAIHAGFFLGCRDFYARRAKCRPSAGRRSR